MTSSEDNKVFEALCSHVVPFPCPIPAEDEEQVLAQMVPGRAEVVLLGEATHGTEEFYQLRRLLTKHLILERGFRAILLEVRSAFVCVSHEKNWPTISLQLRSCCHFFLLRKCHPLPSYLTTMIYIFILILPRRRNGQTFFASTCT